MTTRLDCTEEILTDLLGRIPHLALLPCEEFDEYWQQIGTWLLPLDEGTYYRWAIRFTIAIHQSWGVAPEYALNCIKKAVREAKQKEVRL